LRFVEDAYRLEEPWSPERRGTTGGTGRGAPEGRR
jgi:hypothetical protein